MRLRPRLLRQRGGVAVTVAIVLGAGVIMGSAALVVDVGQLYAEREQLQSGADSAALAVAKACALDDGDCADQAANALSHANRNAKDGFTAVTVVCGTAPGLSACPPQPAGLSACLGTPPAGTTYVEVRTATLQQDGSTLLPPVFARGIAGNQGYQGKRLTACARVAYQVATKAVTKAFAVSACEYQHDTAGGTSPPPSVQPGEAQYEHVFYEHGSHDVVGCPTHAANVPGGYGWLPDDASTCHTNVTVGMTFTGKDPATAEHDCLHGLTVSRSRRLVLIIGVYDTVTINGSGYHYHIVGLAPFVVTGFANLDNTSLTSSITGQTYCTGAQSCIYGYFTRDLLTTDSKSSGPSYGATVITTIG